MAQLANTVRTIEGATPDQIPFDDFLDANEPVILRGLVSGWKLVEAGRNSTEKAMEVLEKHSSGRPVGVYVAPSDAEARFFTTTIAPGLTTSTRVVISVKYLPRFDPARANPTILTCI